MMAFTVSIVRDLKFIFQSADAWGRTAAATAFLFCFGLIATLGSPAQVPQKQPDAPVTIQANVNRVLVPVIVRDRLGNVVTDLKREDFHVFDNDKARAVSAFSIDKRGAPGADVESKSSKSPPSPTAVTAALNPPPPRFVVFLFDDMHLTIEDLARARTAGMKLLAGTLVDSDYAEAVSLSGRTNSGVTRDRTKLQEAIAGLQPRSVLRPDAADCPKVDYYQADLIENKHDQVALQDVEQQLVICNPPPPGMLETMAELAARRALTVGQLDVQVAFASLSAVVRGMAALPGQRTMILVSPGFLTITPEAWTAESRIIDLAAQNNVTISALDARGVYVTEANASDDARGRSPGVIGDLRLGSMTNTESVMSELADGTGGIYFHHNNDLDAGFKSLSDAQECVYMLELPLDGVKQNGSYHRLKVKVDRDGLQLQARHGYFVPKPQKGEK
jgi:VWFA-related protein